MSALQCLSVLVAVTGLSFLFVLIYKIQEGLSIPHRQRIIFLKMGLLLVWFIPLVSWLVIYLKVSRSMGGLLTPTIGIERVLSESNAQLLAFETDSSKVVNILMAIYLAGVTISLVRLLVTYLRMKNILVNSKAVEVKNLRIWVNSNIETPFSFGFFRPRIYLPKSFLEGKSESVLEVVLAHEEVHLRHRDPQWKMFSLMTRSILFFSPALYYIERRLELEMEIECDRATMGRVCTTPKQYGLLLIESAAAIKNLRVNSMFTYMSDTNLKGRIHAMKTTTTTRPFLNFVLAGLILLGGMVSFAMSTGLTSAQGLYHMKAEIFYNGKLIASPRISTVANEPTRVEITSDKPKAFLSLQMQAGEDTTHMVLDGIELKMEIEYKTDDRQFKASPQVIVSSGKQALVWVGAFQQDTLEMKVIAFRK